ncbi:MAG: SDR family oxidoreductase [Candidatus Contubernalis sp.]|nr:SDR family oxidoreductase [Candidatus Contubernalis sp.]
MNIFDLSGKIAVVTGASSGLGRRFSKVLAENGADVAVVARRVERLEDLAEEIRAQGRRCLPIQCDVTSEEQVAEMTDRVVKEFGRLDISINNAGTAALTPAEEHTLEDWNGTVAVNLTGVFLVAKHCAKAMIKHNYGKMVLTASMFGLVGNTFFPASSYHATKGAVVNLTRGLAAEWGKYNITVNAIAPGFFPSEMTKDAFAMPEFQEYAKNQSILGRTGQDGELDGVLLYLSSDASSYTTGVTIPVDGGWTAI